MTRAGLNNVQRTLQATRALAKLAGLALALLALNLPFMRPLQAATHASATGVADAAKKSINRYKVDVWETEQGLPQNTVQTLFQTRNGHLWVGTTGGLARFDGTRFVTFESSAVPELIAGSIFGFMEDAQGNLWIGHSRGAARFRNGRFERAWSNEVTQGRRVWAFAQAVDGTVWAASESGLVRWQEGQGVTKVYKQADGLPTERLRTLDFDKDGTLWIGTTGGGLVSFKADTFKVLNPGNGFPHLDVRHVLADAASGIWAATAGAGLVHVAQGQIKTYTTADGLPTDHLTYLTRDPSGALWIGTWGAGLSRLSGGRFSALTMADGLTGDQIWSALVDREGSVWVGTWHAGLNRVSQRAFGVLGQPEGLPNDNVRSVIQARDGATWVSTAGGGVSRIEQGRLTATVRKKNGLVSDETSALLEDREGALWIGTYTEGLARWKNGALQSFGTAQGLPNLDVRALLQDRAGTVWVGTNEGGLARFNGHGFVPMREAGAPLKGITTLFEDRSGVLWVGTSGQGLFSYHNGAFTTLTRKDGLVSNWVLALHEDANGSLWIGTNGEGLNRLANGKMSGIRTTDGLWDGTTQVILEDHLGHLWFTCNRGFFRVPRSQLDALAEGRIKTVHSTAFGRGHALRSTTFAGGLQAAGSIDARGQLWLPSFKGLVIVDPARLPGSEDPPSVAVEGVQVDGVEVLTQSGIVLPPGSLPLSIRYRAGTLLNADRVQHRYQMEGTTQHWVEVEGNREANFPALPHGHYRFRVAASLDGVRWQEAAQPLAITVQPHAYQTPWFAALAIFSALATAAGLYRLRTHQLRQRHAEMERVVAEKTEALRLANEHLSRLSFADALTGLANRRRLDEVQETEWRRAARAQTPLAVVLIDIDSFKAYNDSLGHPEGDKCLAAVADVIRQAAGRAGDFAARYGGEEFMVLIPGMDQAGAKAYAEKLRQACEARAIPHPASPVGPVVTISIGVAACVPTPELTAAALVAEADAALYRAKRQGRNRVG